VICPLIALLQWQNEILRFTKQGSLKVFIHHGPQRAASLQELQNADVVLTTYSIIEVRDAFNLPTAPRMSHTPSCTG
jgi:DNA repair protein RAD16